jgi:CheY-like chemotaxis protein
MQAFGERIPKTSRISEKAEEIVELKNIRGAQVLLVEDNEINQQVALEILQGAGLNVTVANDGQEGVDAAIQTLYDAILMDIQMPVMDGYEATKRIRKWEGGRRKTDDRIEVSGVGFQVSERNELQASDLRTQNSEHYPQASNLQSPTPNNQDPASSIEHPVPIIAMTAHAMAGDREKSIEAGMNDHVAKPIDTKELFSTLAKWIEPGDGKMQVYPAKEVLKDEAAREGDPFPELQGISVSDGLKHVGGNKILYRKLLIQFFDTNRESVNEIKEALKIKDQTLAVRLAHTVKGVAATLGAGALAQVAGELEKELKSDETGELSRILEQFESHLNQVMQSIEKSKTDIKDETVSGESSGQDYIDNTVVGPIIRDLFNLMESDLVEASNRLNDLAGHLADSIFDEQFKMLENQMDIFDIPAALDTLKAIANELNLSLGEEG